MHIWLPALMAGMFLTLTAPVAAQQKYVYECNLKSYGQGFSSAPVMLVELSPDAGKAVLLDGQIYHAEKGPVSVDVTKPGANQYRMRYELWLPSRNEKIRVRYTVTLDLAKESVLMSADFPGYDNTAMGARGKCVQKK
ncbi:MAG: hypothetical protein ACWA5A_10850 [Marinibacterium sp.]